MYPSDRPPAGTALSLPFGELRIIRKFQSRKNEVYLVERDSRQLVLKIYDNGRCQCEAATLLAARDAGIAVPAVADVRENALLMEFIPGKSVNDYLGSPDMERYVLAVADWLASFHKAFRSGDEVRVRSDARFRNFLVNDRVYGIDLELSRMGRPEEDVGEALAHLLDTDPMFTGEKFRAGRRFVERYEQVSGMELKDIDAYLGKSLREAAGFRPRQRELLIKKAGEIEASRPFLLGRTEKF